MTSQNRRNFRFIRALASALLFVSLFTLAASAAHAGSWYQNKNGGFGIYVPEGWRIIENGRSATLLGPEKDSSATRIFLGSDWDSRIKNASDLPKYAADWSESTGPFAHETISGLEALRAGSLEHGAAFVFRLPENVIVIESDLRGSPPQLEEARTALSSISIRTKPVDSIR